MRAALLLLLLAAAAVVAEDAPPASPTPTPAAKSELVPEALQKSGADAAKAMTVADTAGDPNLRIAFFAKAANFEPAEGKLILTGASPQALMIAGADGSENVRSAKLEDIFGGGKRGQNMMPLFANATEVVIDGKPVPFGNRIVLVVKNPVYTQAGGRIEWTASSPPKGHLGLKTNSIAKSAAALSSESVLITDKEARSPVLLADAVMVMSLYVPHISAAMAIQKAAAANAPPQVAKTPPATPESNNFASSTIKAIDNAPIVAAAPTGRRRLLQRSKAPAQPCGVCLVKTAAGTCVPPPAKAPKCVGEVGAPGFWDCGVGQYFTMDGFIGACVKV